MGVERKISQMIDVSDISSTTMKFKILLCGQVVTGGLCPWRRVYNYGAHEVMVLGSVQTRMGVVCGCIHCSLVDSEDIWLLVATYFGTPSRTFSSRLPSVISRSLSNGFYPEVVSPWFNMFICIPLTPE